MTGRLPNYIPASAPRSRPAAPDGQAMTRHERRALLFRQQREEMWRAHRAAMVALSIAARLPVELDVAAIRNAMPGGITQGEFAARFGFTRAAVREWEQGRRRPGGSARVLLHLIAKDARRIEAVIKAAIASVCPRPRTPPGRAPR
jgi:DNA-binding transcriptional regulator YiaG